jgi:hypothetical protein
MATGGAPRCACNHAAAVMWSAWACVSRIQSMVTPSRATIDSRRVGVSVPVQPDFGSKSSAGSITAPWRLSGSQTTCEKVELGACRTERTSGLMAISQ